MVSLEDLSSVMILICKLGMNKYLFSFEFYCSLLFARNPAMVAIFRKREQKWLSMLDDWEKYMTYKYKKV